MQVKEMVVQAEKNKLTQVRENVYNLDFGRVSKGSDITDTVTFKGFQSIRQIGVSCGCTTATMISKDKVEIGYNNQRLGTISQRVTVNFEDGTIIKINIIGGVL